MFSLDRQGWITVVAGELLSLITLFTSYTHVTLPVLGAIPINQQGGIPLLLASLATLVVDAQLATRRRSRDQSDRTREADLRAEERIRANQERFRADQERDRANQERFRSDQERDRADQERDRAAEERERALRRAQRQNRGTVVQLRHQLAPTPTNARHVADLIALLEEYGDLT